MRYPHRERVPTCIARETYLYLLDPACVVEAWTELEAVFGPVRRNAAFRVMELRTPRLILRSTFAGNPISVIRRRACTGGDIRRLHEAIGYGEPADGEGAVR